MTTSVHPHLRNCNKVIMVGTSIHTMGGISTVVQGYTDAGLFDRATVRYVATHIDGSSLTKLRYAISAYLSIIKILLTERATLFHVHLSSHASFWRKLPIFFMVRLARRPYIIHLHGSEFMTFYRAGMGPLGKKLIRSTFDNAARILALSPAWRDDIAEFTTNPNIDVLLNAVPVPEHYTNKSTSDGRLRLLFLGRLGNRKGIYDILAALDQIRDRVGDFELIAAGDGEIDAVKAEVVRRGLQNHVKVPGWIAGPDKHELLKSSHIFLLPSYAEGLPMSLLEAMAAGLAIVTSTVGGIPSAIAHGQQGLLVEPGEVEALAQALLKLMTDEAVRAEYGRGAFERARSEFSVDSAVSRLLQIYRSFGIAVH